MSGPLIDASPYPTTDDLSRDAYSLRIISPAYASSFGELNSILQYLYQSVNFSVRGMEDFAATLKSIAAAETVHLELLAKTISALGAQPVFCAQPPALYNFYSTKFVSYSVSFKNMVEDDIMAEKYSVLCYGRMLSRLRNEKVKNVISRIVEDEKLHLSALQEMLCKLKT